MSLTDFSRQLADVVEAAAPGVVTVRTQRMATASALHYSENLAVTADHAIQGHDVMAVALADGRTVPASIAGRDPGTDLAVVRLAEPVAAPSRANAVELRAGALALAVGRSSANAPQAALGILSLVGEAWRTMRGGQIDRLLRLDIGLHPGQSGGLVVDAAGQWIGVATRGLTRLGAVAIPMSTVDRVVAAVMQRGRVVRGYLGVGLHPVPLPAHLMSRLGREQRHGMILVSVEPDGPAEKAGLILGDLLTGVDGKPIEDTGDLLAHLDAGSAGKTLTCEVLRGGKLETVAVTVGEKEEA